VAGHRIYAAKTEMICDFLVGWRPAVLPPMTFNEVGQRPLFGSEWLYTVWIYTIMICACVNEFCSPTGMCLIAMKEPKTRLNGAEVLTGLTQGAPCPLGMSAARTKHLLRPRKGGQRRVA
jgi:hypothetical protein